METTSDFLERLRTRLDAGSGCSDYKLAKVLQVSTGGMTNYLKHGRSMDDDVAVRLAELLELNPGYVVACCHAERSKSVKVSKVWQNIAAQYAACLLIALPFMSLISGVI